MNEEFSFRHAVKVAQARVRADSVSKHNIIMSSDDCKKIAAGTHEIVGLSGQKGQVILAPVKKQNQPDS